MSLPILLYDASCDFCKHAVLCWQKMTGQRVDYVPQENLSAVTLVLPDGQRFTGAKAVCRLLAEAPHGKWLWFCYRFVPLFAPISEVIYRLISRCRNCAEALKRQWKIFFVLFVTIFILFLVYRFVAF